VRRHYSSGGILPCKRSLRCGRRLVGSA
jgi:hypothetical protein